MGILGGVNVSQKMQQGIGNARGPVAHIYAFAITWAFFIFIGAPENADVIDFVVLAIFSSFSSGVTYLIVRPKNVPIKKDREVEDILKSDFVKRGNEDAKEVVEALAQIKVIQTVTRGIKSRKVLREAGDIVQVSKEMINKVVKNPELIPSIRRFFSHFLPTAVKLITDYEEMEKKSVHGENIRASMKRIEEGLEMLKGALIKQLDSLFSHAAMDLETDVDVLESILKKDGLIDKDSMRATPKKEI